VAEEDASWRGSGKEKETSGVGSEMGSGDEERKRERRRGGETRARVGVGCRGGGVGGLRMDERRRRIARARERHIVAGVLGGGGDWRGVLWLPCVAESRRREEISF
jgi:hypothetical protein